MRTLRLSVAGTVVLSMAGVLPLGVTAQTDPDDAASGAPGDVTLVEGLVYATGSAPDEATERKLDLYLAAEGGDAPMVVHVGGRGQTRGEATPLARALTEHGVSVFVASHPDLWPDVQLYADPTALRTMVEAVACAVRFARGSEYGSETAPLVLAGFSRHGGTAAHVALAGESFDRVWEEYHESGGGPPAQYDCTASEASTHSDAFVGVAGAYDAFVGYESKYGRDHLLEHEPDLWETLWGTVGLHPELRVRLIHGDRDGTIPLGSSAAFEAVLAEAGYDAELVEFEGGHSAPGDLVFDAVMELVQ